MRLSKSSCKMLKLGCIARGESQDDGVGMFVAGGALLAFALFLLHLANVLAMQGIIRRYR